MPLTKGVMRHSIEWLIIIKSTHMGCDIHAIIEKKATFQDGELFDGYWMNAGDPDIGRNYDIFAVLANVRNEDDIPYISDPRGLPKDVTDEMKGMHTEWNGDAHSTSYVTLKEMKDYDINQEYYSHRLITDRDSDGKITGTCAATNGKTLGEVGMVKIFREFPDGDKWWKELIHKMDQVKSPNHTDNDVRLVFFFDN